MPSKCRMSMVVGHDPITDKPIIKTFNGKTKKSVREKMDKFKLEATTGVKQDIDIVTFDSWANRWLYLYKDGEVEDTTFKGYQYAIKHLNESFAGYPINMITPIQVQEFFKAKSKMSGSSVQKFKNTANLIFQSAVDNGYAFQNPIKNIKPIKYKKSAEKRVFTLEQARVVKEYAKTNPDGLGVYIILSTGIRCGELMGIRPAEDFDFKNNRITIQRTIQESGGYVRVKDELKNRDSFRIIPISQKDSDFLNSVKECHKEGFLFQPAAGKRDVPTAPSNWAKRNLRRFYNSLNEKRKSDGLAPVQILRPHELRHTYGTLLFKSGSDIYAVQKIMGHKNIDVTMKIYVHDDVSDVEKRVSFPEL